jgi:hypothetical protein
VFEAKFDKKFKFTNPSILKRKDFTGAKSINLSGLRRLRDDGGLIFTDIFHKFAKAKFTRLLAFSAAECCYSWSTQGA